jgi:serine protease Do
MKCFLTIIAAAGLALLPGKLSAKDSNAAANLDLARQLNQAFVQVAEDVEPSVVVITVIEKPYSQMPAEGDDSSDDESDPFNGMPPSLRRYFKQWEQQHQPLPGERQTGQGSGIIIRKDGYILTNRHVVEDAERIEVRLKDGRVFKAKVRGVDAPSDVAVIKIDAKNLPVAKLADSSKTRVGEFAIAIGAPFALEYSVTFGHVSAKDRSGIVDINPDNPTAMTDQNFIQTDANINPGNSGGPLVNIDGEVIGINTLIRGLHTGIGFAIPINLAREVSDQLITNGKFSRSWLGIQIVSLREYPKYQRLLPELSDGVVVREIVANGPAAKSDLEAGDVVTAIDGKPVTTSQELKDEIRGKKAGQSVVLAVSRITNENGKTANKQLKISVKPGEWMETTTQVVKAENKSAKPAGSGSLGMTVKTLTKDLADELGVEMTEGVVVSSVDKNGLAARADIKPGDIITKVNRRSIANPKQFRDATKNADTKNGVVVNVISDGSSRFEVLKDGEE